MMIRKLESKLNTQNRTYWVNGYVKAGKERIRKPLDTRTAQALAIPASNGLSVLAKRARICVLAAVEGMPAPEIVHVFCGESRVQRRARSRAEKRTNMGTIAGGLHEASGTSNRIRQTRRKTSCRSPPKLATHKSFPHSRSSLLRRTSRPCLTSQSRWLGRIFKTGALRISRQKQTTACRLIKPGCRDAMYSMSRCSAASSKFAVEREMIAKSPFRYVGKPGEDSENGASPFSKTELDAFVRNAGGDLLSVLVLLRTGLRRSDAIRLQWKHVGPAHISLTAQKMAIRFACRCPRIWPKHSTPFATNDTARLKPTNTPMSLSCQNPYTQKAFDTGKKLYERIQNVGERAGVKRAHPHRFRDSFAKDCFLKGCTVAEVAAYLGDNPETVSAHYGEMDADRLEHADKKVRAEGGLLKSVDFSEMEEARKLKVVAIGRKKERAA